MSFPKPVMRHGIVRPCDGSAKNLASKHSGATNRSQGTLIGVGLDLHVVLCKCPVAHRASPRASFVMHRRRRRSVDGFAGYFNQRAPAERRPISLLWDACSSRALQQHKRRHQPENRRRPCQASHAAGARAHGPAGCRLALPTRRRRSVPRGAHSRAGCPCPRPRPRPTAHRPRGVVIVVCLRRFHLHSHPLCSLECRLSMPIRSRSVLWRPSTEQFPIAAGQIICLFYSPVSPWRVLS